MVGPFVFPAHAGMSLADSVRLAVLGSFPRSRGDEPSALVELIEVAQFSPLTRG